MIIEDSTTQYIGNYNNPRTGNMGHPYANYKLAIYGGFHKWRSPQNAWFILWKSIKLMIWGYPYDLGNLHI